MVLSIPRGTQTASTTSEGTTRPQQSPGDDPQDWIVIPIRSLPLRLVLFLAIVLLASWIGRKAIRELAAERLAQTATIKNLQEAIRRVPSNAEYHHVLAQVLEGSMEETDWKRAVAEYESATKLNPHNAFYWLTLARAYEVAERIDEARHAVERASQADPSQPLVAWQVANFQVRHGNWEEALRQFRVVLSGSRTDPQLGQAVFDLAWRGTQNNRMILNLVIPSNSPVAFGYMNFLLEKGRLDEALEAWHHIALDRLGIRASVVFPLFDALIKAHRVDEAEQLWKQVVTQLQFADVSFNNRNLIVDGSFESDILNGGFDWRFTPEEHVELQFDSIASHGGTRSLSIAFDGQENIDYNHLFQLVPVQPDTHYRFRGWMRAEQITTDSGPHFEITDLYAPSTAALLVAGEPVIGSSNWQEISLEFRTGAETRVVRIALVRPASHKIDNKIQGRLWIDDLSLQAVPLTE